MRISWALWTLFICSHLWRTSASPCWTASITFPLNRWNASDIYYLLHAPTRPCRMLVYLLNFLTLARHTWLEKYFICEQKISQCAPCELLCVMAVLQHENNKICIGMELKLHTLCCYHYIYALHKLVAAREQKTQNKVLESGYKHVYWRRTLRILPRRWKVSFARCEPNFLYIIIYNFCFPERPKYEIIISKTCKVFNLTQTTRADDDICILFGEDLLHPALFSLPPPPASCHTHSHKQSMPVSAAPIPIFHSGLARCRCDIIYYQQNA